MGHNSTTSGKTSMQNVTMDEIMQDADITAIGWADGPVDDQSIRIWLKDIVWVHPENEKLAKTKWKVWRAGEQHSLVAMPEFFVNGRWLQVQYVFNKTIPEELTVDVLSWLYHVALITLGIPFQKPGRVRAYMEPLPWAAYEGVDEKSKAVVYST